MRNARPVMTVDATAPGLPAPRDDGPDTLTQLDGVRALLELTEPIPRVPATVSLVPRRGSHRATVPQPRRHPRVSAIARLPWPLFAVLAVQAALSLRLVWSNTASQDEALYLWSGRMEWSSLLHGTPVPPFATFFSGAPVIYPPLGAVAVAIGGLAGARILSLCFMLGAAVLLWDFTSRLSGRRAAFFATGLWAVLGPTQYLGAYATYDAMSLFLVVLAAWLASHAGIGRDATGWVMGAAGALVAANAAKYASAIFDPVVIAVAALVAMPQSARKEAIRRSAAIAGYVTAALIMLLTIGGGYYVTGVDQTTLTRAGVGNSVLAVLESSWSLVGVVIVASAAGAVICLRRERDRSRRILILVLAGAGLLVPAEQARIHTLTSLNKHVDFGAWFAAVAAGYAIDCGMRVLRPRIVRGAACVACGAALIVPALAGAAQAKVIYAWPDSAAFIAAFRPLVASTSGPILDETPYIAESSLAAGATWERWSNTRSIRLPSGKTISVPVNASGDPGVYQDFIRSHYFTLIALNFTATPGLDQVIKSVVSQDRDYRLVAVVPYGTGHYVIWRYDPQPAVRAVRRSRK
jgi:4-amino-4-deoxy-L-arabinose transferase-like glycosyltransferase